MRRTWKIALVWTTVAVTAASPASACRGRFWRVCQPSCYVVCEPCAPVECCGESTGNTPTRAAEPVASPEPEPYSLPVTPREPVLVPTEPAPVAPIEPAAPIEPPVAPVEETPAVEPPAAPPEPAADDMPVEPAEPAAPTAEPAKPADDVEDLFKETDSKPAEEMPAEPAAPAAEPAKSGDDVDELFKETDDKKAASSEPASAEPMDPMNKPSEKEVEDLFSDPSDKMAETQTHPLRHWTDNTGKFQVRASLVSISPTHVRLLKDTGKYTTVLLSRLSQSDLAFVQQHATSTLAGKF